MHLITQISVTNTGTDGRGRGEGGRAVRHRGECMSRKTGLTGQGSRESRVPRLCGGQKLRCLRTEGGEPARLEVT